MPIADIAILTVIPEEYSAVISSLISIGCNTEHDPGTSTEPNLYGWVTGDLSGIRDQVYRVVVGIVVKPGPGHMANAVRATYDRYKPAYILIVGIAGGFPLDGLTKGDVAISSVIFDYEYGKIATDFQPRTDFIYPTDQTLLASAVALDARDKSWAASDTQLRPDGDEAFPKLLHGAIASGGKVVDDATNDFFAAVLRTWPKLLAVEMEGAGAAAAIEAMRAAKQNVGFLMVRGISDMPKTEKDDQSQSFHMEGYKAERDKWKRYAATTAANFTVHWISRAWPLAPRSNKGSGSTPPSEEGEDDDSAATQQAIVGDVAGNNNSIIITQLQGASIDDIARLTQAVPHDANAEIDSACVYMNGGDIDIAIHLLNELRKKKWDKLGAREKFRVEANLGLARERKGEFKEAAKHYLEAKRHQPQDDMARAMEALAYYHHGDEAKAYELAGDVIKDHPHCSLAIAIRIRSAAPDVSLAMLEEEVPEFLSGELEILHALGWRALNSGNVDAAERFAGAARRHHLATAEINIHHAIVIVQKEVKARQANQTVNKNALEKAVAEFTEAIDKCRGQKAEALLRYNRAEAYDLLNLNEDAETDFRAAIDANKEEPDITRRFALFLIRHDRNDAAIDALRKADRVEKNVTNRLLLAELLALRKGAGDWDEAIAMLRETLPENPEPITRAVSVATLAQLFGRLGRHEEAISCLDELDNGYLRPAELDAIRSTILFRAGRKDEARASALNAMQSLSTDSPEDVRVRVADALGHTGAKSEALSIWKELLTPDSAEVFVGTALKFANETGDDAFIMSFCKSLRASGIWRSYAVELEAMTLEKYRAFDDAISVLQEYIAANPDNDESRVFRVRLSRLGVRLDRSELVESDIAKLPRVETARVRVAAMTAQVLKHGQYPERGIEYAYELVRLHFDDPIARQAYLGVIGIGEDQDHYQDCTVIRPGCAVKFTADDTGEEKWIIIENSADPSSDRDEIAPGHIWAKEMAGKVVGESFLLRRDPFQDRTATIQFICSKYAFRKFEILDGWEARFPDQPFARAYTFSTNEDGSPDMSLLLQVLDHKEQQREELHAIYRNNPISATMFARLADAGLLESLSHLASEGTLPIRCCRGTQEERQRAEEAISGEAPIIIESSALATLFFSGHIQQLQLVAGRCVVCEGVIEEYVELRRKLASSSHASVGKIKGKYLFSEDDPTERQRQIDRLEDFISTLRSMVTIRSGESLAKLPAERRAELIDLFGEACAEAIAEAASTGGVLWTDDIAVAEVAKEIVGVVNRVWTQIVFRKLAPSEVYIDLTLFLLHWRYFFTRIEPEVVLAACHTGSWNGDAPSLLRIIEWLGMPEITNYGAAAQCVLSLRLIWREGIEVKQKEDVARQLLRAIHRRPGGRQTLKIIARNLPAIFVTEVTASSQCGAIIRQVLDSEAEPRKSVARTAMMRVIQQYKKRAGLSDDSASSRPSSIKEHGTRSDPTPKELAEQRKADRKRKKTARKRKKGRAN